MMAGDGTPETGRLRFWAALAPAMVVPFVASLVYFVVVKDGVTARFTYSLAKVFILVWPFAAARWILREPMIRLEIRSIRHVKALPLGAAAGLVLVALMFAAMATPLGHVVVGGSEAIRAKALQFGLLSHYWVFALALSIVHSLVEEVYWRWFVFGRLRRVVSLPWAHLLAGAAFAAHHVVVTAVFFSLPVGLLLGGAVGLGGVSWSLLYQRQGTLAGAWLCHAIVDMGIMAIGYKLLLP